MRMLIGKGKRRWAMSGAAARTGGVQINKKKMIVK